MNPKACVFYLSVTCGAVLSALFIFGLPGCNQTRLPVNTVEKSRFSMSVNLYEATGAPGVWVLRDGDTGSEYLLTTHGGIVKLDKAPAEKE